MKILFCFLFLKSFINIIISIIQIDIDITTLEIKKI